MRRLKELKTSFTLVCKIIIWSKSIKLRHDPSGVIWASFDTPTAFIINENEYEFLKTWDKYGVMNKV